MSSLKNLKRTKRGKTVLGPLNLEQLYTLLKETSRPRDRARVLNRIDQLKSYLNKQAQRAA